MKPLSITLRVALLFAGASALVLFGAGLWVSAMLVKHFEEQDIAEIKGKLALVRNLVDARRQPAAFDTLPTELARALVGHEELGMILLDADGDILFAKMGDRLAETMRQNPLPQDAPREFRDAGRGYRGMGAELESGVPGIGRLRVGVLLDITHHEHFLAEVRSALWAGIALVTLLMGALGWAAARGGLAPLRALTRRITSIQPTQLSERVPHENVPPELRRLVDAFNAMLARLDDGYTRLSEFSSDIAHELRTPLANLRTQTEVSLGRARSAEEYRAILHSALEEYDHLSRTVGDMLFLAKADNGLLPAGSEPVVLHEQVAALAEFYDALAEDRGVRIAVSGEATTHGDAPMLRRAISNLLSNAIRHAERGSEIRVALGHNADRSIRLSVTNRGSEIPREALPRLFDRFYRSDPARVRDGEGSGLGLAITHSIIRAHGGIIEVRSADGETVFECRLNGER